MYGMYLKEMAQKLVKRGLITEDDLPNAQKALGEVWVDQIAIVWTLNDVFTADATLTRDQAHSVLARMLEDHDAEFGLNWDTIGALCPFAKTEEPITVKNLSEFYDAYAFSIGLSKAETEDIAKMRIRKLVYQYTECGAWVRLEPEQVSIGSIVEGVSIEAETQVIPFPFTITEFWKAVDDVEKSAQAVWDATHGCPKCNEGRFPLPPDDWDQDSGEYMPVDPNCEECYGEGWEI